MEGAGHFRPAPNATCNRCSKMLSSCISLGFSASMCLSSENTLIWMIMHQNVINIIWNIAGGQPSNEDCYFSLSLIFAPSKEPL